MGSVCLGKDKRQSLVEHLKDIELPNSLCVKINNQVVVKKVEYYLSCDMAFLNTFCGQGGASTDKFCALCNVNKKVDRDRIYALYLSRDGDTWQSLSLGLDTFEEDLRQLNTEHQSHLVPLTLGDGISTATSQTTSELVPGLYVRVYRVWDTDREVKRAVMSGIPKENFLLDYPEHCPTRLTEWALRYVVEILTRAPTTLDINNFNQNLNELGVKWSLRKEQNTSVDGENTSVKWREVKLRGFEARKLNKSAYDFMQQGINKGLSPRCLKV